jgi:hypothetical protein
MDLHSREALVPVFADLNKYDATTHFIGQNTIFTLTADRATGVTYCLAHHVTVDGEKKRLMIASLRYLDTFEKADGDWLFAERLLYVDWIEERVISDNYDIGGNSGDFYPINSVIGATPIRPSRVPSKMCASSISSEIITVERPPGLNESH